MPTTPNVWWQLYLSQLLPMYKESYIYANHSQCMMDVILCQQLPMYDGC